MRLNKTYIFFVDYLLTNPGPIYIHGRLLPWSLGCPLNKGSTVTRASVKNTFHSEASYTQAFKSKY